MAVRKSLFSRISFGGTSALVGALLLLSYLGAFVDPAKAWFFTLFGLLYPVLLPLAVILFVWALVRKSSMRGFLALALVPSVFFLGRYYRFTAPEPEAEPSLSLVSYNVGLFSHGPDGMSREVLADSVSAYLMKSGAHVICLQEFRLPPNVDRDAWIRRHFPGYSPVYYLKSGKMGSFGNLILSRKKVLSQGKTVFEKSTNLALYADIALDSSVLRIFNCHFESYNISIPRLVKGIADEEVVEEASRKMRRSITGRPRQVADVLSEIERSPYRTAVLGDFNDTPLSFTYTRLLRGRKDAFSEAGKGFGATYRALWPLLRIDYMLYPGTLAATSYRVEKVNYSDHYPIFVNCYETGRNAE